MRNLNKHWTQELVNGHLVCPYKCVCVLEICCQFPAICRWQQNHCDKGKKWRQEANTSCNGSAAWQRNQHNII